MRLATAAATDPAAGRRSGPPGQRRLFRRLSCRCGAV